MKKAMAFFAALAVLVMLMATPALANGEADAAAEEPELDLTPSEGMEFESNGDGTCTLVGLGTCTDTDIVIPTASPDGDTVTLIAEYALAQLEDVDSVTLAGYEYEVDERAFQYGEFETLNIVGGTPVIGEYAFYDCEDLTTIRFSGSDLEIGDYAFQECGDDAAVTFTNCLGTVGKRAFQYDSLLSLTFGGCEMEIDEYAFYDCEDLEEINLTESSIKASEYAFQECGDGASLTMSGSTVELDKRAFQYCDLDSLTVDKTELTAGEYAFYDCEDLAAITFTDSTIEADEYAFQESGSNAVVEMTDCSVKLDKRAFQYCSIASFSASGSEFTADEYALYFCENMETVVIDFEKAEMGKYAFSNCPDLTSVSINESGDGELTIDDRAFQYCDILAQVSIGGTAELGKYVFDGCADGLVITIAGTQYTAGELKDGQPAGQVTDDNSAPKIFNRADWLASLSEEQRKVEEELIGATVEDLYASIGEPSSAEYTTSCLVADGEDGMLKYDGFYVSTTRMANGEEYVMGTGKLSPEPEEAEAAAPADGDIRPEIKETIDSYEAFFNEYADFMESYDASDASALTEYLSMLKQYTETMQKLDDMEGADLNDAELAYYTQAMLRIDQRLLEVAS